MKHIILIVVTTLLTSLALSSQETSYSPSTLNVETKLVVSDIDIPWGIDWLPDGSMLVTEKSGKLYHILNEIKSEITGLPLILHKGQGGLLDITVHPKYSENGWIYLSYSSPSATDASLGTTAIGRGKIVDGRLTNFEQLYKGIQETNKGYHFGSRIVFDRDGYLFFGIGDRGEHFVNPQDITRDGGKIYRLYDDGRVPDDNPFVNTSGARTAIWSYGHRNPQGLLLHPVTGEIWEHEHGPMGGDEINIIHKGLNYGWPVICYGINYDGSILTELTQKEGMEQPLFYFKPSIGPCGFAYLDSDVYPGWKGSYLLGSLSFEYLERVVIENGKLISREKVLDKIGRLREVKIGPDGHIYIGVEGKGILKIVTKQ